MRSRNNLSASMWLSGFACMFALLFASLFTTPTMAQSLIAGDISGRVTDPSGAVVPNATVELKGLDSGIAASATTSSEGQYRFSLLKPGRYELSTSVPGFAKMQTTVTVQVGQTTPADLKLEITKTAVTIEVTSELPLMSSDPGTTTSYTSKEVELLPSPGGDMTNIAFSAPGAVVNVTGGYGNFTVNGLPATSNLFTVNGENDMDPYFNINNTGATNLTLGSNEIQEANVVTNPYSGQYGTLIGSQVTYVTKGGTNDFHGNAQYWWNGRFMNANDFFSNSSSPASDRPFSNANQWAASVGGPIIKNKLFFFADTEGLRFILPNSITTRIPTPAFAAAVLNNVTQLNPAEASTYKTILDLYEAAPGSSPVTINDGVNGPAPNKGCTTVVMPGWTTGDPCAETFTSNPTAFASEWIVTGRVDYNFGSKDNAFFRFKIDHGLQPSYLDPISSVFDANSNQPAWDTQLVWNHSFSTSTTNAFTAALSHYVAQFAQDTSLVQQTLPYRITSGGQMNFTSFNPASSFPQGRNVTQYQFIDDLSMNRGRNSWKFGINFRRYDVSDHNFFYNTPRVNYGNISDYADGNGMQAFADGVALLYRQADNFATDVPIALWGLGFYAEDQIKVKSNFTLTLALRAERNSNPVCQKNCFANATGQFSSLASVQAGDGAGDIPYSNDINSGQHQAFQGVDALDISPRVAFSWAPGASNHLPWFPGGGKTVISGGYGLFYDSLAAGLVDQLLSNPPVSVLFPIQPATGVLPFDPAGAPATFAAASSAFSISKSYNQIATELAPLGINFQGPTLFSVVGTMHAPRAQEWNFMVQQQIGRNTAFTVNYSGNSVTRLPYSNGWLNTFDNTGLPNPYIPGLAANPVVPNYGNVQQFQSGAISNYNGVSFILRQQFSTNFMAHFSYTYAHNLDEASNGGIFTYGDSILGQLNPAGLRLNNYGNSDYDIRHNLSADFVYTPTFRFENKFAKFALNGWQWSGKVYWRTGLPFSVIDGNFDNALGNGTYNTNLGQPIAGAPRQTTCGASTNYTSSNTCLSAGSFVDSASASFTGYPVFPQQSRNQYWGPKYFNMDMALYKNFRFKERMNFAIGMNAFNVFNHPNLANPDNFLGDSTFGQSTAMLNSPTSPYGNFLGFDSSVRVVQLTAKITF